MGITIDNLCNSCSNIGCVFQSGIVRTECAFYMPPHIETDNSEFQPVLVSWYTPDILHTESKVVCRNQSQLDFFRETLNVPHYEQRIYTLNENLLQ